MADSTTPADRTIDVFAVGNALMDVQARVPEGLPAEVGFEKGVMTLADDEKQAAVLARLAQLEGGDISRCPGGSAANTVMGLVDFGGTGAYACKTADDEIGRQYLGEMQQLGVKTPVPAIPGAQTGTSVILITPDAERTMLTNLAASATLSADDIEAAGDLIAQSQWVYLEGYLFSGEPTKSAALRVVELARQHGTPVAFTMSDPFMVAGFKDDFTKLIESSVDLLFCNLEEARAMTGEDDAMACAAALHERCDRVALTLGGDGSLLMADGVATAIDGVACEAIDTTGAGDMYAAGVLYGLTSDLGWEAGGRLASAAAARVVSQLGARLQTPFTPDEVAAAAAG